MSTLSLTQLPKTLQQPSKEIPEFFSRNFINLIQKHHRHTIIMLDKNYFQTLEQ